MFDDCIIMAGGSGTRLWPASNSRLPKQFLPVSAANSSRTFFSSALERGLAVTAPREGAARLAGRVIIIAGKDHAAHVVSACVLFDQKDRDRMMLIVEPLGSFLDDAAVAADLARRNHLAVFGIVPTRPETGYGYIEAGAPLGGAGVCAALSFREKPDRPRAEEYLASGRFYWNSGMFAFSSSFMLGEFRRHAPQVLAPFAGLDAPGPAAYRVERGLRVLDRWPGFAAAYARTQIVSIDYAIAERCAAVALIPSSFSWTDIGNWDEYAKLLGDTGAEVYRAGAEDCFVDSGIPVALCGVEGLIVSVRSGKDGGEPLVFIAKKGETQRVREIVEQIRAGGRSVLL
ncbi:MAG: mannose-1-phosphate guanylyltransferase [Treponema sp.]|jgi:mannose-1-phosphate guanylyltransferase|nr:mannose-1-phosphate guanylyltransferase [Treponema sp.]